MEEVKSLVYSYQMHSQFSLGPPSMAQVKAEGGLSVWQEIGILTPVMLETLQLSLRGPPCNGREEGCYNRLRCG